jgi:hypothetical protein
MKKSFLELIGDNDYKKEVINALTYRLSNEHLNKAKSLLEYVIDKKLQLFVESFSGSLYYEDDDTMELILPSVIRVYGKIFIEPPPLFNNSYETTRYQLFKLMFDIDSFIDYLIDMLNKCKESLIHFEFIDRTAETLSLIVDNYVAMLINNILNCDNIDTEITKLNTKNKRDLELKNILGND